MKLEHLYRWPNLAPPSVHRMDVRYAVAFNSLIFALGDVKRDLERLDRLERESRA